MNTTERDTARLSARCPVSGASKDIKWLCQVDDYQIWRCPSSATDFVWPMPSDADLTKIYDRAEWFNGGERGGYVDYDEQTQPSLQRVAELLERYPNSGAGLSILDVGCGYGSHLKLALDRGWKCSGIETSQHARRVANERYGKQIQIVARQEDLMPKRFDVILMLDVIEHLQDPYKLFFTLFGKGAIDEDTLVVISTPNARCFDAMVAPATWTYRHPPSHLVFYSAKSLEILLHRLMFTDVQVRGEVAGAASQVVNFADELASVNDGLSEFQGLLVEAKGSHFKNFMHERYVPGGFWKLTEYEHMPRYSFAALLAKEAAVLDFGCGTGYGSAFLSQVARSVVGLDISQEAIDWATTSHIRPGLSFERHDDLGVTLPAASFDVVTCFEMIEHVNYETQVQAVASIARLLKPSGKLIMSTPDPLYTAPYGDNPYHLREMTEAEFVDLLQPHFKHIKILRQWVRPSILIGEASIPEAGAASLFGALDASGGFESLIGFVAICSNSPLETMPYYCQFDTSADFNLATLGAEHRLNDLRLENRELSEFKALLESEVEKRDQILAETRAWVEQLSEAKSQLESEVVKRDQILTEIRAQVDELSAKKSQLESELGVARATLDDMRGTLVWRVARFLRLARP